MYSSQIIFTSNYSGKIVKSTYQSMYGNRNVFGEMCEKKYRNYTQIMCTVVYKYKFLYGFYFMFDFFTLQSRLSLYIYQESEEFLRVKPLYDKKII